MQQSKAKKNKTNIRMYKINVDVFQFVIHIVYCKYELFDKIENKILWEWSTVDDIVPKWLCCYSLKERKIVLWIFDNDKTTLIHEMSHAIDWMYNFLSLKCNWENTELRANVEEYLYSELLRLKLL